MKVQISSGVKTVASAGTRVALSETDLWVVELRVAAPAANSGVVYIGDSTVSASNGRVIAAGGSLDFKDILGSSPKEDLFPRINLKDIYVDAATNGDKLTFNYFLQIGLF